MAVRGLGEFIKPIWFWNGFNQADTSKIQFKRPFYDFHWVWVSPKPYRPELIPELNVDLNKSMLGPGQFYIFIMICTVH